MVTFPASHQRDELAASASDEVPAAGQGVLLTRARAGAVNFVPMGAETDPSRAPADLGGIASALVKAGAVPLEVA